MSEKSILLGLDGSAQSRYAAEIAWSMAKAGSMRVDAQHVIDSLAAWDFLNFDIAGFIGSGPYFEAHETMRAALQELGQSLIGAYTSIAEQNGIVSQAFLDEGTTIREICGRAKKYDMVVIGQRGTGMGSPEEDKRKLPRRSIAESLTHYCPKPLLVVQDRTRFWNSARIMLGTHKVDPTLVQSAVDFTQHLRIEPSVQYLFASSKSSPDKTAPNGVRAASDIEQSVPALKGKKIEVQSVPELSAFLKEDAEKESNTLLIMPVVEVDGVRTTAFGWAPDVVVRYLNHSAVLFWMQDTSAAAADEASQSVSNAVS
jgi:nucleotide-binding universal stress UspA family protein